MKNYILIILCICIIFAFVACEQNNIEEPLESNTELFTIVYSGPIGDPPYVLAFSSLSEIQDFITATKGSENDYRNYTRGKSYIDHGRAKYALQILSDKPIPIPKDSEEREEYSKISYTPFIDFLTCFYEKDGVRYDFWVYFEEYEDSFVDSEMVKKDVLLGENRFDLYRIENSSLYQYEGSFFFENYKIEVRVGHTTLDKIAFDDFVLVKAFS